MIVEKQYYMAFREVDDNLWEKIKSFLPPGKIKRGEGQNGSNNWIINSEDL